MVFYKRSVDAKVECPGVQVLVDTQPYVVAGQTLKGRACVLPSKMWKIMTVRVVVVGEAILTYERGIEPILKKKKQPNHVVIFDRDHDVFLLFYKSLEYRGREEIYRAYKTPETRRAR